MRSYKIDIPKWWREKQCVVIGRSIVRVNEW
jgi:hypothetical protein